MKPRTLDFSHSREALGRAVARRQAEIDANEQTWPRVINGILMNMLTIVPDDDYENFVVPPPPMIKSWLEEDRVDPDAAELQRHAALIAASVALGPWPSRGPLRYRTPPAHDGPSYFARRPDEKARPRRRTKR